MSTTKNPSENTFGNDTVHRFGAEIRRFILHQTDLAQPYIRWQPGTVENLIEVIPGTNVSFFWQVNGSLVVDHTYIQWGTNPDPINNPEYITEDNDEHAGEYYGGTGWDDAENGATYSVTYSENITLDSSGVYYFIAKAQGDQIYADVLMPEVYGDDPYLRLIKERTDDNYREIIQGKDGTQEINGQTWWYSPVIQVYVINNPPQKPSRPIGPNEGSPDEEYEFSTTTSDPDGHQVLYQWDWGDGTLSEWIGPFNSNEEAYASYTWSEKGSYKIKVIAKDTAGDESPWSNSLSIEIPRSRAKTRTLFLQFLENFPVITKIINYFKDLANFLTFN